MKHYILINVEIPNLAEHNGEQSWHGFLAKTEDINQPSTGIQRIAPNCWLLERENAASALARIVSTCEGSHLTYHVRYLSDS